MINDNLQIFENRDFGQVRVIEINNEPWFIVKDIATILGYTNTKDALKKHIDEDDKRLIQRSQIATFEIPNRGLTIINESGLYSLILSSKLPTAKKFKRWVTSDVLPTIRKHGIYAVEEVLDNPDMLIAALTELKAEREKCKALETTVAVQQQQISELKPKASYYDLVLNCKNLLPISVIAKDYGWSAIKMNNFLKEKGVQYKQGDTWLLYQKYADKGYTHTKTFACHKNGGARPLDYVHITNDYRTISVQTYWTQAGRLFIYNLMKANGLLPLIEQDIVA